MVFERKEQLEGRIQGWKQSKCQTWPCSTITLEFYAHPIAMSSLCFPLNASHKDIQPPIWGDKLLSWCCEHIAFMHSSHPMMGCMACMAQHGLSLRCIASKTCHR